MDIKVKRQVELGSEQWGVYVNGELREGGFFSRAAALACASATLIEMQPEEAK